MTISDEKRVREWSRLYQDMARELGELRGRMRALEVVVKLVESGESHELKYIGSGDYVVATTHELDDAMDAVAKTKGTP